MYRYLCNYRNTDHTSRYQQVSALHYSTNNKNQIQNQINNYKGTANTVLEVRSPVIVKHYANPMDPIWIPGEIQNKTGNVTYDVRVDKDTVLQRHVDQLIPRKSVCLFKPELRKSVDNKAETDVKAATAETVAVDAENVGISNNMNDQTASSDQPTSRYFLRPRDKPN